MAPACRYSATALLSLVLGLLLLGGCCRAELRYVWGNALEDDGLSMKGPDGDPYPSELIDEMYKAGEFGGATKAGVRGRALFGSSLDPRLVGNMLMETQQNGGSSHHGRARRSLVESPDQRTARNMAASILNADVRVDDSDSADFNKTTAEPDLTESSGEGPVGACASSPPAQLCPTKYNTTAPMWGTSLTSGKKVTIVQKFPDLLQQVIFHECTTDQCDLIHGRCTQTFTPYLFLVIPLGPVTLTGQDYVMVESGCACQPKYSSGKPYDTPLDAFLG